MLDGYFVLFLPAVDFMREKRMKVRKMKMRMTKKTFTWHFAMYVLVYCRFSQMMSVGSLAVATYDL